jgi:hypothetical protein
MWRPYLVGMEVAIMHHVVESVVPSWGSAVLHLHLVA